MAGQWAHVASAFRPVVADLKVGATSSQLSDTTLGRLANLAVIAVVDDLFFAVRIQETARRAGLAVDVVSATKFQAAFEKLGEGPVEAVILDLNLTAAIEMIGRLKHEARTQSLPIIGFVSHVASDIIAAARAAGCDQVLARSAFTSQLPELLRKFSQRLGISGQGLGDGAPAQVTGSPIHDS